MVTTIEQARQHSNWPMVLIDTSVLLVDPDVLVRIIGNKGLPFITNTVLDELDYNKNNTDPTVQQNARKIFRVFANESSVSIDTLPNGHAAQVRDRFSQLTYNGSPVFVVSRGQYARGANNDAKIIEVAKAYGMRIITRDQGLKVRAECEGIAADLWTGPRRIDAVQPRRDSPRTQDHRPSLRPFAMPKAPIAVPEEPLAVSTIPREGNVVRSGSRGNVKLLRALSSGGEGTIYRTDRPGFVCKVYHQGRITTLRRQKIELMLSRPIDRDGICWPVDTAFNDANDFVGFFMPEAEGKPIQTSVFVKPVLEKTFPGWKRVDLVRLCLAFLEHVEYLHRLNIIIGDINPLNLLVTADSSRLWIVDTDSFQIEGFPCPVGTVNFTAPEIQGRSYSTFLRSKDHELFAIATMLFMILHPGKPPYAQQGGGDPGENIRNGNFSYPLGEDSSGNAPEGPWRRIWSNLIYDLKDAFSRSFKEKQRLPISEWHHLLEKYRFCIEEQKSHSNDLFPDSLKILDPIEVACGKCGKRVFASRARVDSLAAAGKSYFCGPCHSAVRLQILAQRSLANQPATGGVPHSSKSWAASQPGGQRPSHVGQSHSSAWAPQPGTGGLIGWLQRLFK